MSSAFFDTDPEALSELNQLEVADDESESQKPPRRILRAECILSKRTSRFLLVVECLQDSNNYQAVLRTADSFGIQNVWVVQDGLKKMKHHDKPDIRMPGESLQHDASGSVSMASGRWLTMRHFDSTAECIEALRADQREIWVTTLVKGARKLTREDAPPLPERVAIVLGRELDGVSAEMVAAAKQAVFLPMIGFSESFNVSVAAALVCQRLFDLAPDAVGAMSAEERMQLRQQWYRHLSPSETSHIYTHWLPRWERTLEIMHETIAREGEAAVLRPAEETRLPQITKKLRKRIESEGQRPIHRGERASLPTGDSDPTATSAASSSSTSK